MRLRNSAGSCSCPNQSVSGVGRVSVRSVSDLAKSKRRRSPSVGAGFLLLCPRKPELHNGMDGILPGKYQHFCRKAANLPYRISLKYRRWREVFRALGQVRRYGKVQAGNAVKELLWALFRDAWGIYGGIKRAGAFGSSAPRHRLESGVLDR